jgi:hypothetical protein
MHPLLGDSDQFMLEIRVTNTSRNTVDKISLFLSLGLRNPFLVQKGFRTKQDSVVTAIEMQTLKRFSQTGPEDLPRNCKKKKNLVIFV